MKLLVVIPVFNEESVLSEFYRRLRDAAQTVPLEEGLTRTIAWYARHPLVAAK